MVILTYQPENARFRATRDQDTENDTLEKGDGPKTAYIDRMCKFKEEDAEEEKCDLFFICQDGEVAAHRLVISNASKYIMAMQDDQPPWYPVYITVPDLSKEIVQTLVQLAYTGQMNIPQSIGSDDLLDAMQALGWIHTDCLEATYTDSMNDEDTNAVSFKTAESLETVLKMSFPVNNAAKEKVETGMSDEEDGMEMDLPDIPISDDEGSKTEPTAKKKAANKELSNAGRRQSRRTNKPSNSKPEPAKKASPPKPKVSSVKESSKKSETPSAASVKSEGRNRGNRKAKEVETEVDASPPKKESADIINSELSSPETVRSRTRTIRKPKKFDDAVVLTPTKRKDSPTKSPAKSATKNPPKPPELNDVSVEPKAVKKGAASNHKESKVEQKGDISENSKGAMRRSTSTSSDSKDTPRNSLITSYFSKRSPRRSDDFTPSVESSNDVANTTAKKDEVIKTNTELNSDGVSSTQETTKRGRKSSNDDVRTNTCNTSEEAVSASSSTLRRRARSTASSKSDKDVLQDDTKDINDGTSKALPRRKRNLNESQNSDLPLPESTNPAKRGRKPSTVSNSSNKDPTADGNGNAEDVELDSSAQESPKKKRNRVE